MRPSSIVCASLAAFAAWTITADGASAATAVGTTAGTTKAQCGEHKHGSAALQVASGMTGAKSGRCDGGGSTGGNGVKQEHAINTKGTGISGRTQTDGGPQTTPQATGTKMGMGNGMYKWIKASFDKKAHPATGGTKSSNDMPQEHAINSKGTGSVGRVTTPNGAAPPPEKALKTRTKSNNSNE